MLTALALGWSRIGAFGFGGGPGMIPQMRAECVDGRLGLAADAMALKVHPAIVIAVAIGVGAVWMR